LKRVLAEANNGDELFWEEKFHAPNGKAQGCTQGALPFSLLSFGEKGGGSGVGGLFFVFPHFPMCFHYVPMNSHEVSNVFTKFTMCSRTWSPYALTNVGLLSPI